MKESAKETKKDTRRLQKAVIGTESVFQQKLTSEARDGECESSGDASVVQTLIEAFTDENFFNYMKMLSPAALDLELRSLVTLDSLSLFVNALTQRLHSHRDFEAVQAIQNVFLRMHGDVLIANQEMQSELEKLSQAQQKESQRILELIASSLGTLGFVKDTL